jgi:putative tryptophan/tyrosine transport system substrate-binding protein
MGADYPIVKSPVSFAATGQPMVLGHMQRRDFITLLGSAAAWPLAARAQQTDGVRRIGVLMPYTESDTEVLVRISALEQGLQKLGWVVGRNLRIDYRSGGTDLTRIRALANELVALMPDALLAGNTSTLAALQQATHTTPIVFVIVADPVGGGFVQSFARPGGNITGFVPVEPPMGGKWLSLLKEVAPGIARAAVIFNPDTAPYAGEFLRAAEAAAQSLAVKLIPTPVHDGAEIELALAALGGQPGSGLIVMADSTTGMHRKLIITLAARHRLPSVYPYRYYAADGSLMSYGTDQIDDWRRAASYLNAILHGAKPADLPVQAATKYELVINLKTAKALGLEVPWFLQQRADEVIE